jgi:hypothetical protein
MAIDFPLVGVGEGQSYDKKRMQDAEKVKTKKEKGQMRGENVRRAFHCCSSQVGRKLIRRNDAK